MDITTYTKMPQCHKCGEFHPLYKYMESVTEAMPGGVAITSMAGGAEALMLTCHRCDFTWLMMCIPEDELS